MTNSLFARNLVRKSKRALRSARLDLQDGDFDGAVNRSYYAMFDMARASLLNSGVPEDRLPRTQKEVIAAFRQHAIESGRVSVELAGALSRTEVLRLQADYSGTEIDQGSATDAVARAVTFVQTVERVFSVTTMFQSRASLRTRQSQVATHNRFRWKRSGVKRARTGRGCVSKRSRKNGKTGCNKALAATPKTIKAIHRTPIAASDMRCRLTPPGRS